MSHHLAREGRSIRFRTAAALGSLALGFGAGAWVGRAVDGVEAAPRPVRVTPETDKPRRISIKTE